MIKAPDSLKYTATHEWIRREPDGSLSVGITDFAQDALGDIVFVEFPKVGARLAAGANAGVVESVKAASDIYAPVAGEVVAINDALADALDAINKDAYGAWLYRIRPSNPDDVAKLMDATAYAATAEAAK